MFTGFVYSLSLIASVTAFWALGHLPGVRASTIGLGVFSIAALLAQTSAFAALRPYLLASEPYLGLGLFSLLLAALIRARIKDHSAFWR